MDNIVYYIFPLSLIGVIILQVYERKILLDRESRDKEALHEQITKLQTALISKSATDYTMIRAMDKTIKEEPKKDLEHVDGSELTDEEFDKMLTLQNT